MAKDANKKDNQVRIPDGVLAKARIVAVCRGVPLAQYLGQVLGPIVDADHAAEIRKQAEAVAAAERRPAPAKPKGRP